MKYHKDYKEIEKVEQVKKLNDILNERLPYKFKYREKAGYDFLGNVRIDGVLIASRMYDLNQVILYLSGLITGLSYR